MPIGSKFDVFAKDVGILQTTTTADIKKVLALQIEEEIQAQRLTKTAVARHMRTSRGTSSRISDKKVMGLPLTKRVRHCCGLGQTSAYKLR